MQNWGTNFAIQPSYKMIPYFLASVETIPFFFFLTTKMKITPFLISNTLIIDSDIKQSLI